MGVAGLTAHLQHVLVMHDDQMVEQGLASLQQETNHHGITLMIGEPFDVGGIVPLGLLEEIIEKRRR